MEGAKTIKLSSINPNPNNPRLIKDDQYKKLVKSIEQSTAFGDLNPITVDINNRIIAGNMRYKACQELRIKEFPVQVLTMDIYDRIIKDRKEKGLKDADATYDDVCDEWIIKDNVGFGEDDWNILANEWDADELNEWGLVTPDEWAVNPEGLGDEFSLPDGDKSPFQQMTFTLADEQAEQIKNAISDIKETEEFKFVETLGNENGNGNALYLIIMQWAEQRR